MGRIKTYITLEQRKQQYIDNTVKALNEYSEAKTAKEQILAAHEIVSQVRRAFDRGFIVGKDYEKHGNNKKKFWIQPRFKSPYDKKFCKN